MTDKPRLIPLTDPDEIASAKRNELGDIVGGWTVPLAGVDVQWWGYEDSVRKWRERRKQADCCKQADSASGAK